MQCSFMHLLDILVLKFLQQWFPILYHQLASPICFPPFYLGKKMKPHPNQYCFLLPYQGKRNNSSFLSLSHSLSLSLSKKKKVSTDKGTAIVCMYWLIKKEIKTESESMSIFPSSMPRELFQNFAHLKRRWWKT